MVAPGLLKIDGYNSILDAAIPQAPATKGSHACRAGNSAIPDCFAQLIQIIEKRSAFIELQAVPSPSSDQRRQQQQQCAAR